MASPAKPAVHGRPCKLSPSQWEVITDRLTQGDSISQLAKEYGVSRALISGRASEKVEAVKEAAKQLVSANETLQALSISDRVSAINLAERLKSISNHLGSAADFGARTAHKLSALAHNQTEKLDDYEPMKDIETLSGIKALTQLANEASAIPLNLLRANKESVDELNRRSSAPERITRIEDVIVDTEDSSPEGL